jgi:hypothetical protein
VKLVLMGGCRFHCRRLHLEEMASVGGLALVVALAQGVVALVVALGQGVVALELVAGEA